MKDVRKHLGQGLRCLSQDTGGRYRQTQLVIQGELRTRYEEMDKQAEEYFKKWKNSVKDIKNADLERRSEGRLEATRRRYREVSESWKSLGEDYEPVLAELRDQVVYLEHDLNEDGPQPEKGRGGARGARERALSIDGRLRVHRLRVHQRSRTN